MARPENRQARSVGNLGDVLKHAALLHLATALAARGGSVVFVDTHAYLLHAPPADRPRWEREVDALASAHPAYARYQALERASLEATGHHRCSSGIVLDALGERLRAATLGEANAATRARLREQVAAEGHAGVVVALDAAAALRDARVERADALLIHVDPFSLSDELWASLAPALDAVCEAADQVALVVYRYTRKAPSAWPAAPRGTLGPVAWTRGGPHELAAYAAPRTADLVRASCAALGWRLAPPV